MRLGWIELAWCLGLFACGAEVGDLLDPPPLSLEQLLISPSQLSMAPSQSVSLRVEGVLSDGATVELSRSSGTSYSSDDPDIAEVSEDGEVTAVEAGQTMVRIEHLGLQARVSVEVTNQVNTLSLSPANVELLRGQPFQMSVFGERLDGLVTNLLVAPEGLGLALSSEDERIATIDEEGLVVAGAPGSTELVAQLGALSARAMVTVLDDTLVELNVSPNPIVVVERRSLQLSVVGRYADGRTEDLSDTRRGTSYSLRGQGMRLERDGRLYGDIAGAEGTLEVMNGGITVLVPVQVIPPVVALNVVEVGRTKVGGIGRYQVIGTLPDGDTIDLSTSDQVEIIPENVAIASAQNGVFFGRRVGHTALIARWGEVMGEGNVHVDNGSDPVVQLRWAHRALHLSQGTAMRVGLEAVRASGRVDAISEAPELMLSATEGLLASPGPDGIELGIELEGFEGAHSVEAFYEGVSASLPVQVDVQASPTEMRLLVPPMLEVGDEAQLVLLGFGPDDAWIGPLTPSGMLMARDPLVEIVGPMRVRGAYGGVTTMTIEHAQLQDHRSLRVVSELDPLVSLTFSPSAMTLPPNERESISLRGIFDSDARADLSFERTSVQLEVYGPVRVERGAFRLKVERLGPGLAALRAISGVHSAVLRVEDEP